MGHSERAGRVSERGRAHWEARHAGRRAAGDRSRGRVGHGVDDAVGGGPAGVRYQPAGDGRYGGWDRDCDLGGWDRGNAPAGRRALRPARASRGARGALCVRGRVRSRVRYGSWGACGIRIGVGDRRVGIEGLVGGC